MRFASVGLGGSYADTFQRVLNPRIGEFPDVPRTKTLLIASDFGGEHRGHRFETYSFLFLDLERNSHWIQSQPDFRQRYALDKRRLAFKAMGDHIKRAALIPFLRRAHDLDGMLVVFAISKGKMSLFEPSEWRDHSLQLWKPHIREKLLRVLHISGLFCGALSMPGQDVLWVVDEDSIAANDAQLIQLTTILSGIFSHYLNHDLRHLKCATTKSDDGSRQLEDFVSIADLAAGGLSELMTKMADDQLLPKKNLITPLPRNLSRKSRTICSWFAHAETKLRRKLFILEINQHKPGSKLTPVGFRPFSFVPP